MNLDNVELREKLDDLAESNLCAEELYAKVKGDFEEITYIAKTKAMRFEFSCAIDLIELGAFAGTVVQVLLHLAPDLVKDARKAEQSYFRKRYLSDPIAWEQKRNQQKALMERLTDHTEVNRLYSDEIVERTLIEEGYGLDIKNS